MRHHLNVVAPENLVEPAVNLFAVLLLLLRGEVARRSKRPLAAPLEHRLALDRSKAKVRDGCGLLFLSFDVQFLLVHAVSFLE